MTSCILWCATCIKCTTSYNLAQKKLQLDIVRDNMGYMSWLFKSNISFKMVFGMWVTALGKGIAIGCLLKPMSARHPLSEERNEVSSNQL